MRLTGERRMILERLGASLRVLAAARQGKVEAALRAVDRLESFPPPADPRAQLYHRAIALLEAGRAEAAMKLIASARSFHMPEDTYTYELDLLEVRCQIELRGAEYGVIAAATSCIAWRPTAAVSSARAAVCTWHPRSGACWSKTAGRSTTRGALSSRPGRPPSNAP